MHEKIGYFHSSGPKMQQPAKYSYFELNRNHTQVKGRSFEAIIVTNLEGTLHLH